MANEDALVMGIPVGPIHEGDTPADALERARLWLVDHRPDVDPDGYRIVVYWQVGAWAARVTTK